MHEISLEGERTHKTDFLVVDNKDNGDACVVGPGLAQGNGRPCPYMLTDNPGWKSGNGLRMVVATGAPRDAAFRTPNPEF